MAASWASAIGTFGAVAVSLWLAYKETTRQRKESTERSNEQLIYSKEIARVFHNFMVSTLKSPLVEDHGQIPKLDNQVEAITTNVRILREHAAQLQTELIIVKSAPLVIEATSVVSILTELADHYLPAMRSRLLAISTTPSRKQEYNAEVFKLRKAVKKMIFQLHGIHTGLSLATAAERSKFRVQEKIPEDWEPSELPAN